MTVATDITLHDLIAEEVGRAGSSLDAGEVAERIVAELPREELERLSFKATRREVVEYVAHLRPSATPNMNGNISGRWEKAKEALDDLETWRIGFMDDRPMKALLDCSPQELDESAEWYEARAEGYAMRANAYRELAKAIRRAKKATPADLPREKVRRILDA